MRATNQSPYHRRTVMYQWIVWMSSIVAVYSFTSQPNPFKTRILSQSPCRDAVYSTNYHEQRNFLHKTELFSTDQNNSEHRNEDDLFMNRFDIIQSLRKSALGMLMGSIMFFNASPGFAILPTSNNLISDDQVTTSTTTTSIDSDESTLLSPRKLAPATDNVLDEVWTLVDKFYIDRSFNGNDWKEVKTNCFKKNEKFMKNNDNDGTMKLVTDMVKLLGDKYSRVLDPQSYAEIQKFDLIGVGVTLMPNENKELIVGAPPVPKSAADRAGLKPGDFVTAVNGKSTSGRNAFDIIDQISENPNAETVSMTVRTQDPNGLPGEGFTRDVEMQRIFQEVKDPIFYKISETRDDGTKVGYVRIMEFNTLVKGKMQKALKALEEDGANAFVLDLRGNPGGAFQSAVEISSLFFDSRVATYVVDSSQVEIPFKTSSGEVLVDPSEPVAIWVNERSASASEVFAGSMHDNCRAVVMGEKSFGKGLIQAVYGLKNGAGLVLTVASYVTPSGTVIQGKGIEPDIRGGTGIYFPGLVSDTSKVDFKDIGNRLGMCKAPQS